MKDLLEELWTPGDHLGGLDSYNDFADVLSHITEALPETIRAGTTYILTVEYQDETMT